MFELLKKAIEAEWYVVDVVHVSDTNPTPAVYLKKMQQVTSSNLYGVAYVPETKTLHVKFQTGARIYKYADVSQEEFNEFCDAESKGSFFAKSIKSCKKCS